mmetsp:Transcript_102188/g.327739  ORF Transcript_102188/g.327739 Transcript_102188/m.327739 type:complete len:210 (-) Transcript_102188:22-651(-)
MVESGASECSARMAARTWTLGEPMSPSRPPKKMSIVPNVMSNCPFSENLVFHSSPVAADETATWRNSSHSLTASVDVTSPSRSNSSTTSRLPDLPIDLANSSCICAVGRTPESWVSRLSSMSAIASVTLDVDSHLRKVQHRSASSSASPGVFPAAGAAASDPSAATTACRAEASCSFAFSTPAQTVSSKPSSFAERSKSRTAVLSKTAR